MFRVDFPKILVNSAAIIGIWFLYFNISSKVGETTIDLLKEPFIDDAEEEEEEEEERIRKIEREIVRRTQEDARRTQEEARRIEEVRRIEEAAGKTDQFCFKLLLFFPYIKRHHVRQQACEDHHGRHNFHWLSRRHRLGRKKGFEREFHF